MEYGNIGEAPYWAAQAAPADTTRYSSIPDDTNFYSATRDDQGKIAFMRGNPLAPGQSADIGQGTRGEILDRILGNAGVSREQWTNQLGTRGLSDPYAFLGAGVESDLGTLGRVTQDAGTARNNLAGYLGMLEAAGIDWRNNPTLSGAYNQAQQQAQQQAQAISDINTRGTNYGDLALAALSVWGGGALAGAGLGGGLASFGADAGLGALAGGAGEAGWGVMQGLSPEALSALGTGSAIDVGGTGLTMGEWLAAQQAPFAGMGGAVGAGQLGAGGLGLGSFSGVPGGGFGMGGNTAIEAGMNAGGALPTSNFATAGAGGQAPSPGFSGSPGGGGGQWPGAPSQPGLGQGATQAINVPPGAATPGGAVGSNVGGGSGGGDFVSGILEQFKKNALSIGLMGLSMLGAGSQQGKEPESIKQLGQNASTASNLANQYLAAAQAGQLTGPQQASLDQYKQQAKNQVRQYFASIGQFDSTSRIQAEAQIDQTAVAMQQQLIQQTLQNGLALMGASNTPLTTVAQYQAGQDQALVNAMGNFAQGIGSLFGQKAGQGQINQPQQQRPAQPQQNPQFPPNTGPQQPPLTQNQPIIQQEPFVDQTAP